MIPLERLIIVTTSLPKINMLNGTRCDSNLLPQLPHLQANTNSYFGLQNYLAALQELLVTRRFNVIQINNFNHVLFA